MKCITYVIVVDVRRRRLTFWSRLDFRRPRRSIHNCDQIVVEGMCEPKEVCVRHAFYRVLGNELFSAFALAQQSFWRTHDVITAWPIRRIQMLDCRLKKHCQQWPKLLTLSKCSCSRVEFVGCCVCVCVDWRFQCCTTIMQVLARFVIINYNRLLLLHIVIAVCMYIVQWQCLWLHWPYTSSSTIHMRHNCHILLYNQTILGKTYTTTHSSLIYQIFIN